jgi:anti-anti-sigma regulatory factor
LEEIVKLRSPLDLCLLDLVGDLESIKSRGTKVLFLDMSEVEMINSIQIGRIVRLALACKEAGITVRAYRLSEQARRTLIVSGVGEMVGVTSVAPPNFDTTQF